MGKQNECACVYVGGYDGPETYWAKTRRARKPNVCGECGRQIQPGEDYEHYQACYEGDWYSHATCLDCLSIRNSFFCDGWLFETVLDNLRDHIEALNGQIASECLAPLTPRALARVCEMIEAAWAHLEDDDEPTATSQ